MIGIALQSVNGRITICSVAARLLRNHPTTAVPSHFNRFANDMESICDRRTLAAKFRVAAELSLHKR
jgi:hypothetical protein